MVPNRGDLAYYRKDVNMYERVCEMADITEKRDQNGNIYVMDNYFLEPGKSNYVAFSCTVKQDVALRLFDYYMNGVAKDETQVLFEAWFALDVLKNAGQLGQKTYRLRPTFFFALERGLLLGLLSTWYSFYLLTEGTWAAYRSG